jgi:hypothetical protein
VSCVLPEARARHNLTDGTIANPREAARPLDESHTFQFAEMLMGAFKACSTEQMRGDLMTALGKSEYYGSVYLPTSVSASDIHGSWAMSSVFLISSGIIPFERIDAEQNLHPLYAADIGAAYGKYSNGALRLARGVARTALTVPTIPLVALFMPFLLMAMRNMT